MLLNERDMLQELRNCPQCRKALSPLRAACRSQDVTDIITSYCVDYWMDRFTITTEEQVINNPHVWCKGPAVVLQVTFDTPHYYSEAYAYHKFHYVNSCYFMVGAAHDYFYDLLKEQRLASYVYDYDDFEPKRKRRAIPRTPALSLPRTSMY